MDKAGRSHSTVHPSRRQVSHVFMPMSRFRRRGARPTLRTTSR